MEIKIKFHDYQQSWFHGHVSWLSVHRNGETLFERWYVLCYIQYYVSGGSDDNVGFYNIDAHVHTTKKILLTIYNTSHVLHIIKKAKIIRVISE